MWVGLGDLLGLETHLGVCISQQLAAVVGDTDLWKVARGTGETTSIEANLDRDSPGRVRSFWVLDRLTYADNLLDVGSCEGDDTKDATGRAEPAHVVGR